MIVFEFHLETMADEVLNKFDDHGDTIIQQEAA